MAKDLSDADKAIANFYIQDAAKNDPETYKVIAGRPLDQVLNWAKTQDDFSDVSKAYFNKQTKGVGLSTGANDLASVFNDGSTPNQWQQAIDEANGDKPPVQPPVKQPQKPVSAYDKIGQAEDYAGAVIQGADKLLAKAPGVEGVKNVFNDVVGPIGESYAHIGEALKQYGLDNPDSVVGDAANTFGDMIKDSSPGANMLTHVDELGVLGMGLSAAHGPVSGAMDSLASTKESNVPLEASKMPVEALIKPKWNDGPQGLADLVKPEFPTLSARELATAKGLRTPGVHNEAAQTIVSDNIKALHDFASAPWQKLSSPDSPLYQAGQRIVAEPTALMKAVEPFSDQLQSLPPNLRTGAFSKYIKAAMGPSEGELTNSQANAAIDKATGKVGEEPVTADLSLNGMLEMRKEFNNLYQRTRGTRTGAMASAAIDGITKDITTNAPTDFKATLAEANSKWKLYKDVGDNIHINKFLDSAPEKAHGVALSDSRVINAVEEAGGIDAIKNVRKSGLYDVVGMIAKSKNAKQTTLQHIFDNADAMNRLYGQEDLKGMVGLAGGIDSANALNARSIKAAEELAKAGEVGKTPEAVPVEIKPKPSKLERFYNASKTVTSVVSPRAHNAIKAIERLNDAKKGLMSDE